MSAELSFRHTAKDATVRATIRKMLTVGGKVQMWQTAGTPGWEDMLAAHWANYTLTMTETEAGSYMYVGSWPATLTAAGWYVVDFYDGATIAGTLAGTFLGYWDGTTFGLGGADTRQIAGSAPAAANVASAFLGTGDVDDVDFVVRNFHVFSDTDHAVRFESTFETGDGLHCVGIITGQYNSGDTGQNNDGITTGQNNDGGDTGQSNYGITGQYNSGTATGQYNSGITGQYNSGSTGQYNSGSSTGQVNSGTDNGQYNAGNNGQYNSGVDIGQINYGTTTGQSNSGTTTGQVNSGASDIILAGSGTILNASGNVVQIGSAAALAAVIGAKGGIPKLDSSTGLIVQGYGSGGVTVGTVTTVTNQLTAAAIATAVWQDTTGTDFNVASSIGKSLYTTGAVPGAASGLAIVGSKVDVDTIKGRAVTDVGGGNTVYLGTGAWSTLTQTQVSGGAYDLTNATYVAALKSGLGTVPASGNWAIVGSKMDLADTLNSTGVAALKSGLGTIPASGNWNTVTPDAAGTASSIAATIAGAGWSASTDTLAAIRDAVDGISAGSGLTAQQTRDALKLAPSNGTPAAGSIDAELDAIGVKTVTIGSGRITYVSTVAESGLATIWAGDDYRAADGTAFPITVDDYAGPSLATATAVLRIMDSVQYLSAVDGVSVKADLEVAATIAIDGTTITLAADLTAAQTATLVTSPPQLAYNYVYEFVCTLANGHIGYRTHGRLTVKKAIAAGA
jgi:hypothetical protein